MKEWIQVSRSNPKNEALWKLTDRRTDWIFTFAELVWNIWKSRFIRWLTTAAWFTKADQQGMCRSIYLSIYLSLSIYFYGDSSIFLSFYLSFCNLSCLFFCFLAYFPIYYLLFYIFNLYLYFLIIFFLYESLYFIILAFLPSFLPPLLYLTLPYLTLPYFFLYYPSPHTIPAVKEGKE